MITNGVMAEKVKALEEENERLTQALVNIAELVEEEAKRIRLMVLAEMENAGSK